MKKLLSMLLALSMILALAACGGQAAPAQTAAPQAAPAESPAEAPAQDDSVFGDGKDYYLTLAAPPASSAMYSFWVGIGELFTTAFPNVHMTVSESQGAVAITKRVRSGECELGNSVSATDYESYNGLGTFEGDPDPDLRMLWYYEVTWEMPVVDAKAGIADITDLGGKKFNPGGTGTSAEVIIKNMADLLGFSPDWFSASQSDAADAYANRDIVGTVKLGPTIDSYIMQLNAAIPVDLVSLTDEQVKIVRDAYPYLISGTIPAGTYDGVDHDTTVVGTPMGCQTRVGLFTQQEQYQLFKACVETHSEIWKAAYPVGADNDIISFTLQSPLPLAAGTVQYLQEQGIEVPAELIPPEFVPAG